MGKKPSFNKTKRHFFIKEKEYHFRLFYWISVFFLLAVIFCLSFYLYQLKTIITDLINSLGVFTSFQKNSSQFHSQSFLKFNSFSHISFSSFFHSFPLESFSGDLVSFTETFSGEGWKDKEKSSAYQDKKTSIISLTPKFSFKEIKIGDERYYPTNSSENGSRNLGEIKVLEEKTGLKIIKAKRISDFWVLTSVSKKGKKNILNVYAYDGINLQKLIGEEFFITDYPIDGQNIILAGNRNRFLVGFVGWESKVLEFKKSKNKNSVLSPRYEAVDVSYWFSAKLFGKLKNIKIIQTNEGYLFYSDRGNLFLLVINNLPLDFAEKLPLSGFDKIEVKEIGINDFKIECFKKTGKSYKLVKLFKFKFLGFEALKSGSFVSINLRSFLPLSGSKVKIKSAEIASYLGAKNGGEMKFYFSVDGGKKWIEAPPGKKVVFKTSFQKNDLRWKVDLISSEKDKVITKKSPFLSQVKIVYEVE